LLVGAVRIRVSDANVNANYEVGQLGIGRFLEELPRIGAAIPSPVAFPAKGDKCL